MRAIPAHYKTPSTDGEDDNPILRVTSRIPLSSVGCPDVSGAVSGALCLLPEGANVGVPADAAILRHKGRSMMSGGGHDELVGRIARKRWRQSTALNEYRPRQLGQVQALHGGRHVEPFVEWPIELELMLLDLRNLVQGLEASAAASRGRGDRRRWRGAAGRGRPSSRKRR